MLHVVDTPTVQIAAVLPCPAWCHGHSQSDVRFGTSAVHSATIGTAAGVTVTVWQSDTDKAPRVDLCDDMEGASLAEAGALADLLAAAADIVRCAPLFSPGAAARDQRKTEPA